ncbi:MAG: RHS repeat-associated core domain-containing protein, partial [Terriglobia bacterium]
YGPFGKRMTTGWAGAMGVGQALTINTTASDRGYTGQEGLDAVQLDDYNARLYDPGLGRFLSVDPLIGHPESTQGINPYSYVENNPLSRTDPTGEMMTEWQSQEVMSMPTGMAINMLSAEISDLQKSGVISNNEAVAGQSVLHQAASTGTTGANSTGGTNVSEHNFNNRNGGDSGTMSVQQYEKEHGGGPMIAANDDVMKQIMQSPAFQQGVAEGMAEVNMDAQDRAARDAANGPLQLTQQQFNQVQINNTWVNIGTKGAVYSSFLAAPEAGALRATAAGLEWGAAHGVEICRVCMLGISLHAANPDAALAGKIVTNPIPDVMVQFQRRAAQLQDILKRYIH